MFKAVEKAIAKGSLECHPRLRIRDYAEHDVDVAIISGDGDEGRETGTESIGGRKIDGMISLSDVESSAIDLYALDNGWNKNIRIGVAIAVALAERLFGKR